MPFYSYNLFESLFSILYGYIRLGSNKNVRLIRPRITMNKNFIYIIIISDNFFSCSISLNNIYYHKFRKSFGYKVL